MPETLQTPAVAFREVSHAYAEGPRVLERISFDVAAGEMVSILGPSGCGKSTLLRLAAGLEAPTSGSTEIDARALGFVFQDPTLLPWLTVRDNIALPLRQQGMAKPERRKRAEAMAQRVKLGDSLDYYPRQLSGGMKMRVSIARALVAAPRILLLDEPFAALDAVTRNHLNEELLDLQESQGWTGLFVTHNVSEAVFLSSRILLLSNRPARLARTLEVPLPSSRTLELRESVEFQRLVAQTTTAFHEVEAGKEAR